MTLHLTNLYPGSPLYAFLVSSKNLPEDDWTKTILSMGGTRKLFNSSLMKRLIKIE